MAKVINKGKIDVIEYSSEKSMIPVPVILTGLSFSVAAGAVHATVDGGNTIPNDSDLSIGDYVWEDTLEEGRKVTFVADDRKSFSIESAFSGAVAIKDLYVSRHAYYRDLDMVASADGVLLETVNIGVLRREIKNEEGILPILLDTVTYKFNVIAKR